MSNIHKHGLPKWLGILGTITAASSWVVQNGPMLQTIPALHGNTLPSIVAGAGLILALFGTPPHVDTSEQGK